MRNPGKPPLERQHQRPVNKEDIRYWSPKYQEWLSLDEMTYRKITRALTVDTRDVETCASPASEVPECV
jgi:hypothetical protein